MKAFALPMLALAALAACDSGAPDTDDAAAPADVAAEPAAPSPAPTATSGEPAEEEVIPLAIRGRWGLVPADCTSTRGDAKGLLVIDAETLKFYESVGTLKGIAEASATRVRGEFEFMGEGMTWRRDVTLDVQDGGTTLIRREYGEDAAPGPFRYAKCD